MDLVPNDPLDTPPLVQSDSLPVEEGTVYGVAPRLPKDPPDLDLLFEGADIPGGRDGGLPFSLEWYAGAKERQRLRDEERERLDKRKIHLRGEWARLMEEDVVAYISKVDAFSLEAQDGAEAEDVLAGLAELVARAAQESPDDAQRNEQLVQALARSEMEDGLLNRELLVSRSRLHKCAEAIAQAEASAVAEDEAQAEAKRVQEARRAKAEEELRRQEALLRGEDPDASPAARPEGAALPPLPPGPAPPEGPARRLARGGPATELPPLQDPPRPGPGGSARGGPQGALQ